MENNETAIVPTSRGQEIEATVMEEQSQKIANRPIDDGTTEGNSKAVSCFGSEFTNELAIIKPPKKPNMALTIEPEDYQELSFYSKGGKKHAVKYLKAQGAFKLKFNHGIQIRTFVVKNDTFYKEVYGIAAVYNGALGEWVTTSATMDWDGRNALEQAKYFKNRDTGIFEPTPEYMFLKKKMDLLREGEFALRSITTKVKRKLILELTGEPGALEPAEYQQMIDELEQQPKEKEGKEETVKFKCLNCDASFAAAILPKTKGRCPMCKKNPFFKEVKDEKLDDPDGGNKRDEPKKTDKANPKGTDKAEKADPAPKNVEVEEGKAVEGKTEDASQEEPEETEESIVENKKKVDEILERKQKKDKGTISDTVKEGFVVLKLTESDLQEDVLVQAMITEGYGDGWECRTFISKLIRDKRISRKGAMGLTLPSTTGAKEKKDKELPKPEPESASKLDLKTIAGEYLDLLRKKGTMGFNEGTDFFKSKGLDIPAALELIDSLVDAKIIKDIEEDKKQFHSLVEGADLTKLAEL